ncbi:MAG: PH domain-containing protein [Planctomycetota bacterium]
MAVVLVSGLSVATVVYSGSVLVGVAASGLLILALNRFFLPTRFEIDEDGITARYPLRRARQRWGEIRRCVSDQHGVFVSTRARRSRFDAYSGMQILPGVDGSPTVPDIVQLVNAHRAGVTH